VEGEGSRIPEVSTSFIFQAGSSALESDVDFVVKSPAYHAGGRGLPAQPQGARVSHSSPVEALVFVGDLD